MAFTEFIKALEKALKEHLPGETAQIKMAPAERPLREDALKDNPKPKPGAVLVLIYPVNDEPYIVLMLRNTYLGVHSAQVSFPGGRQEAEDESLMATALREAEEEIGVKGKDVKIIGSLSELYIPPSGYLVQPFVGFLDFAPAFSPDAREVSELIFFPLLQIRDENIVKEGPVFVESRKMEMKVPFFEISGNMVWGATAMMLSELKEVLKKV